MIRLKNDREPRTRAQKAWIAVGLASLATLGVAIGAATVWPTATVAKSAPPGTMDMPTAVAAAEGKVIAAEAEAPDDPPATQAPKGAGGSEATLAATTTEDDSTDSTFKVNLNLADADQLAAVPGFGKVKARAILAFRQEHPFEVTADIMKVKGMGPASYARVKDYLAVTGPPLVGSPPKHGGSKSRTRHARAT